MIDEDLIKYFNKIQIRKNNYIKRGNKNVSIHIQ